MLHTKFWLGCLIILFLGFFACQNSNDLSPNLKTEKVIILVMDGGRYSETWGDATHQYIPRLANDLAPQGVINTGFYNKGKTKTVAGHTAITTGNYENLENTGSSYPKSPSIFQLFRQSQQKDSTAAWIISSKAKLEVLTNCTDSLWTNQFRPMSNCGVAGLGTDFREDEVTLTVAKEVLSTHQPELVLINFIEPDLSGHLNLWNDYLAGIVQTDEYIYQIWDFIQTDSFYQNSTTLFVTNDHGRHLDGINDGFKSHGDDCEGCQHVYFYAYGPDFKQNLILTKQRGLPDIAATTARLLDFDIPNCEGEVMRELFK